MNLRILVNALRKENVLENLSGNLNIDDIKINRIQYDPELIKPGDIFVAINIYTNQKKVDIDNGHDFIQVAINNGASSVIVSKEIVLPKNICKITVSDTRLALAIISSCFYEYPSSSIKLIGVTGTNGKTTTSHIVEAIFNEKTKIGLLGTLYYKMGEKTFPSINTTPEPSDLHPILKKMSDEDFEYCVLETSSHGIDFHRVHGCKFDVAIFTNLTKDHLDYHKTMYNYKSAKLKLFKTLDKNSHAIVNLDDPEAADFINKTKAKVITYGLTSNATVYAKNIELNINSSKFTLCVDNGNIDIVSKLIGKYNVYNCLAAVACALSQGIDLEIIKRGLESSIRVSGRFELVDRGQDFSVAVDYAHTPDSMANVLKLAASLNPKRIITLFGCGGDRDKSKRPIMGDIAAMHSDIVVLTSDNPRSENPIEITEDILTGMIDHKPIVILDRKKAIEKIISFAKEGDLVLILGKGHETYQILKDETIEFNDRLVVEEAIEKLLNSSGYEHSSMSISQDQENDSITFFKA
ncbi:MAG: UDP-N-acetylmuramoyl-L-alanyl-D-glutamate--2,6-diaminopimelate ligase [Pseudomonadota bacterium]